MFATLLGALPPPPGIDDPAAGLAARVTAQLEVGLEPITDGLAAHDPDDDVVDRWRSTAGLTDRAVKAVLLGPFTAASRAAGDSVPVARAVLDQADRLRAAVERLAGAGCPLVEIEESAAHGIGPDAAGRAAFRDAHARIASGLEDRIHLSLSIVGGSAWDAGPEVVFAATYRSHAFDLIAGPDNWNLVTRTPGERGIVAGVLDASKRIVEGPELMVWAAHYAASTRGRGLPRVGLGTAGSLAHLSWDDAMARLRSLADAARIAALPHGELADALDPRAVSIRAGATGRTRHAERSRGVDPDD
jgi:methionine synthase II (cobalamin-independent)